LSITRRYAATVTDIIGSSRLALLLVAVVILMCIAGAMLPQEGMYAAADIKLWQQKHPIATALAQPLGLFRTFHSLLFLCIVFLLGVNTFTCTVCRMVRIFNIHGFNAFAGSNALRHIGFLILHLSLIILFIGGALSSGTGMDGFIVLTEGQVFKEEHDSYLRLVEGPFRKEYHHGIEFRLDQVLVQYENDYPVAMASLVEINDNGLPVKAEIKINDPLTHHGLYFTMIKRGYSPRISIIDKKTGQRIVDSFVALKTFGYGPETRYKDFLPLPFFFKRGQQVFFTVYPPSSTVDSTALLLVDIRTKESEDFLHAEVPLHGSTELSDYIISFNELRQWASFRVMHDYGYGVVLIALWIGLAGIILRYIPDLKTWFTASEK